MPAPPLDSRSLELIRAQLRALAGLYLPAPRWTGVGDSADPAWRLLDDVFARLLELLIARLNDVPEMHFMRFLDFVGVERSPGSAAAAPVTFLPPKQAAVGGDVPAGTLVAGAHGLQLGSQHRRFRNRCCSKHSWQPLSQLVAERMRKFPASGEINRNVKNIPAVLAAIEKRYTAAA